MKRETMKRFRELRDAIDTQGEAIARQVREAIDKQREASDKRHEPPLSPPRSPPLSPPPPPLPLPLTAPAAVGGAAAAVGDTNQVGAERENLEC